MSAKSKSSSKVSKAPFDVDILRRAKVIAGGYQLVLQSEDGMYLGRGLELPGVMADGATPDACVEATRKALTVAVAYMIEAGQVPPAPAKEQKRTEQVNVRLTVEERATLEAAANRHGYRGVSDFVRQASMQAAGAE